MSPDMSVTIEAGVKCGGEILFHQPHKPLWPLLHKSQVASSKARVPLPIVALRIPHLSPIEKYTTYSAPAKHYSLGHATVSRHIRSIRPKTLKVYIISIVSK